MVEVGQVDPQIAIPGDTEHISWLCLQTVLEGGSVILFCPNKPLVEELALSISQDLNFCRSSPEEVEIAKKLENELRREKLEELLEKLEQSPAGLDTKLGRVLEEGVGFHHAGLTLEERNILEGAFRNGAIRIIVATSSLCSCFNISASRVILLPRASRGRGQYLEMVNMAGSQGTGKQSESILLCNPKDSGKIKGLGPQEVVTSCIAFNQMESTPAMKRALLEVIAIGIASCEEEVLRWAETLLVSYSKHKEQVIDISQSVEFLQRSGFLELIKEGDQEKFKITKLGISCFESSLSLQEALKVYKEINTLKECHEKGEKLHVLQMLFIVVSFAKSQKKLDWMKFLAAWEKLPEELQAIATELGVRQSYIVQSVKGTVKNDSKQEIHQRFYTALSIYKLMDGGKISEVADEFGISRGMLQGLKQAAINQAQLAATFTEKQGFEKMASMMKELHQRLVFGFEDSKQNILLTTPLIPNNKSEVTKKPSKAASQNVKLEQKIREARGLEEEDCCHHSGLGVLTNPGPCCYIGSVLQGAIAVGLDKKLDTKTMKDQEHIALHAELVRLCRARRNPLQQPFSPVGLMEALNPCLVKSRQYTFDTEEGWDAASFLSCLLGELHFLPGNLVETLEEGVCQICGNTSKQVYSPTSNHSYMLSLVPVGQLKHLDLGKLLGAVRQKPPLPSLSCQDPECPMFGVQGMPSHLVPTTGKLLVVHIARLQQAMKEEKLQPWEQPQPGGKDQHEVPTVKLLTPVSEPPMNHREWPGLEAKVVLANSPGHWVAFVKVGEVWWRTDGGEVKESNPWIKQCDPSVSKSGFTVDVVFYAQ